MNIIRLLIAQDDRGNVHQFKYFFITINIFRAFKVEACFLEGHLIRICYINTVPPSQKIAPIIKLLYHSAFSGLPSGCHSNYMDSSWIVSSKVISATPTLSFGYRAFVPKSIRSLHWLGKQKLITRLSTRTPPHKINIKYGIWYMYHKSQNDEDEEKTTGGKKTAERTSFH